MKPWTTPYFKKMFTPQQNAAEVLRDVGKRRSEVGCGRNQAGELRECSCGLNLSLGHP